MPTLPIRREPPPFRRVTVHRTEHLTPHLLRVLLRGDDLEGFALTDPAASVRLLLPPAGHQEVVLPAWNGNEFLHADGSRPAIRTYTPRSFDPPALELALDVVLHDGGVVPTWALGAQPGASAAVAGPGRGYRVDDAATKFLLAGDASALPAMGQLLEHLPATAQVAVIVEIDQPESQLDLPRHPGATVEWRVRSEDGAPGSSLVDALRTADVTDDLMIWAAGEAAAMQRIRRTLFEDRGVPRSQAVVRGYWKVGRGGDADPD